MIYLPYPFKRCTKCGEEYPATPRYFPRYKKNKSGLFSHCHVCNRNHVKSWKNDNFEYYHQHKQEYTESHRADKHAYDLIYSKTHAIKKCKNAKLYHRSHRSERLEYGSKYYQQHKNDPHIREQSRKIVQTRRTRKQALPATFTVDDWKRSLDYFNNCCAVCGRPQGLWHKLAQDHWISLSKGGGYTPENVVPLCHGIEGCNNQKGNREPELWLVEKYGKRKANKIIKHIQSYFNWVKSSSRS